MTDGLPGAVFSNCPECGEETSHEILNGRMGKKGDIIECTIRCSECDFVHKENISIPRELIVHLIVSDEKRTHRTSVSLAEDDVIAVGHELLLDEYPVQVTSIETSGKRVGRCKVPEIQTLWAKRFDKVKMGLSVNRGSATTSVYFWAAPDEEFTVGDRITLGAENIAITRMKTKRGGRKPVSAKARNITRLYGRKIR